MNSHSFRGRSMNRTHHPFAAIEGENRYPPDIVIASRRFFSYFHPVIRFETPFERQTFLSGRLS